jgi:hypothetical protein
LCINVDAKRLGNGDRLIWATHVADYKGSIFDEGYGTDNKIVPLCAYSSRQQTAQLLAIGASSEVKEWMTA